MSLPLFVHPGLTSVTTGDTVELSGEEARHAVVVKRIRVGEQVVLWLDRRHRHPVERQQQEAEIQEDEEHASDAAGPEPAAAHHPGRAGPVPDPWSPHRYSSTGFSRRRTSQKEMNVSMIVNIQAPAVPWPRWKNWKPCW